MKRFLSVALSMVLVLTIALLPGCSGNTEPPETVQVLLYFSRGETLGVAGRQVPKAASTQDLATSAMRELLKGTTTEEAGFGLGTLIPAGTTLNSVVIANGVATVDMSSSFESGGGSLSMLLRVAQVVHTLTQFDGVDKVAFKLDGELVSAIGGEGVVVQPPVTRADFEDQAPAILVESPVPGEHVTSPVTVEGTSNVFEAQFNLDIVDPTGVVLTSQPIHAVSGTGTRGDFTATVQFTTTGSGLGKFVFYDISEADGSRIDVVEIPVYMTK